jgi:hypothetical protein
MRRQLQRLRHACWRAWRAGISAWDDPRTEAENQALLGDRAAQASFFGEIALQLSNRMRQPGMDAQIDHFVRLLQCDTSRPAVHAMFDEAVHPTLALATHTEYRLAQACAYRGVLYGIVVGRSSSLESQPLHEALTAAAALTPAGVDLSVRH